MRTPEENRAHVRADRALLIDAKICIRCRVRDARPNRRTCEPCGKRDARRTANYNVKAGVA